MELRKIITNFTNFIKATTKFYRGFIQRLASHFGIYELEPVVRQFKLTCNSISGMLLMTGLLTFPSHSE